MKLLKFKNEDFELISSWIQTKQECLFWAGPKLSYPLKESEFFKQDDSFMFFLQKDKIKIAFIQIIVNKNRARICKVFVKKDYRALGYSKILISLLIEKYLKEFNIKIFDLNVFTNNTNAILAYQSIGFKIITTYDFIDLENNKKWPLHKMSLEY